VCSKFVIRFVAVRHRGFCISTLVFILSCFARLGELLLFQALCIFGRSSVSTTSTAQLSLLYAGAYREVSHQLSLQIRQPCTAVARVAQASLKPGCVDTDDVVQEVGAGDGAMRDLEPLSVVVSTKLVCCLNCHLRKSP
jgi:hypothetical protein